MTSLLCVATGGWCRRVIHYRPPTPMYRNSPPLCTSVLQIPSLMPLKMRKVQIRMGNRLLIPCWSIMKRLGTPPKGYCLPSDLSQIAKPHSQEASGCQ